MDTRKTAPSPVNSSAKHPLWRKFIHRFFAAKNLL
jgi:hypothetical protein